MDIEDLLKEGRPEDKGKEKKSPLLSLEKDLTFYSDSIKEVSEEIIDAGLSAYPIFIAHQHIVTIGELILDHNELGTEWSIQASTLEEFVENKLIKDYKTEEFKKQYKDPDKFMCIFAVVPEGANFVFYPYK